jgi:transposase
MGQERCLQLHLLSHPGDRLLLRLDQRAVGRWRLRRVASWRCGGIGTATRVEIVKRSDDMKGFIVLPRRWAVERTFCPVRTKPASR